jgi:hypothetical protein
MIKIYYTIISIILLLSSASLSSCKNTYLIDLSDYEKKVYSQNGEDGVLEKIFSIIGTTNKYYVEFGSSDGQECNTRYFKEYMKFNGLLMDGCCENEKINLHKEFITRENINTLFKKYKVPNKFDLLSIDIDGNDFHVWHAINNEYRPRVVVIEYNASHLPDEDKVIQYKSDFVHDSTTYFGASILAFFNLGKAKGYSLVYADKKGVNLFFIRNDILKQIKYKFLNINNIKAIYRSPKYGPGPDGGHKPDNKKRLFVSSKSILNIK